MAVYGRVVSAAYLLEGQTETQGGAVAAARKLVPYEGVALALCSYDGVWNEPGRR